MRLVFLAMVKYLCLHVYCFMVWWTQIPYFSNIYHKCESWVLSFVGRNYVVADSSTLANDTTGIAAINGMAELTQTDDRTKNM